MGINDKYSSDEGYFNPLKDILRVGVALAPVGAGAALGMHKIKSNNPIKASEFGVSTSLGDIGEGIGQGLAKADTIQKQRRLSAAQKLASDIIKEGGVDDFLSKVKDQKAVIQALASTLDDPAAGFSAADVLSHKEKLVNIAQELDDASDVDELVKNLIKTIYTDPDRGRILTSHLRQYQKVAPQLEVPNYDIPSGRPLNPIGISKLSRTARSRLDTIRGSIKGDVRNMLDLVEVTEHTGQVGHYARIHTPDKSRSFRTMVPLDLNATMRSDLPYTIVRAGQSGREYIADRAMVDARVASGLLKREGGKLSFDRLARERGALLNVEDYYANAFVEEVSASSGDIYRFRHRDFNKFVRKTLFVEDRMAKEDTPLGRHIVAASRTQSHTMRVVHAEQLSQAEQRALLPGFAGSGDIDLGVGADRLATQTVDGRSTYVVGLKDGGPLSMMRTPFDRIPGMQLNRFLEPITGRIEQVAFRVSQRAVFEDPAGRMGRGGALHAGAAGVEATGQNNILWSEKLTGGTNRAFLLDVGTRKGKPKTGRVYSELAGTGEAYTLGTQRVRRAGTIPVLDPRTHNVPFVSKILNKVLAAKGEFVDLTPEEIRANRGFIGVGSTGDQFLPQSAFTHGIRMKYQETSEAAGKTQLHLVFDQLDELSEGVKVFGRMHKGLVSKVGRDKFFDELAPYGMSAADLADLGISEQHVVLAPGDMLKKAPGTFIRQMSTAYALASGDKAWEGTLARHAKQLIGEGHKMTRIGGTDAINPLGVSTAAIIRALASTKGVSDEHIGRVLAPVFVRGTQGESTWLKGQHGKLALEENLMRETVRQAFGDTRAARILEVAERGLGYSADTLMLGEGVGDWKKARAKVEPRLLEQMQARMRNLGLAESEISEVIVGLMRRKPGFGDHSTAANELITMAESLRGLRGVTRELVGEAPLRLSVDELHEKLTVGGHSTFVDFLKGQESGVLLDLAGVEDPARRAALRQVAGDVFGGQTEIFLPGGKALSAMRGTYIKTATDASIAIGSEYERLVTHLTDDLIKHVGTQTVDGDKLTKSLTHFKKEGMLMTTRAFHGLASGRVQGANFMLARSYQAIGLTDAQQALVQSVQAKTKGTAVFMDDLGFFQQLKDFMGAGDQFVDPRKSHTLVDMQQEAARKLEMFFTGLEHGPYKGLAQFGARHPTLSMGNVAIVQAFRDVRAVGQADDAVFKTFAESTAGQKALRRFKGATPASFTDIAQHSDAGARRKFFGDMSKNLSLFGGEAGGGQVFMPLERFTVHFGDLHERIDFGLAGAALGDNDGDQWAMFMLDKRAGATISDALTSKKMDSYLKADTLYKIKSHMYAEQAKSHLDRIRDAAPEMALDAIEHQDALKEKASKEATGLLDNRLNHIRKAVLNLGEGQLDSIAGASGLLKVLEEHTTIKGKKLPVYLPFAERLGAAADLLVKHGDASAFRRVLHEEIFQGTRVAGQEGLTVTGLDQTSIASQDVVGARIRLDDDIDTIIRAVTSARSQFSTSPYGSPAEMASKIVAPGKVGDMAFRDIFLGGATLQSGIAKAAQPMAEQAAAAASMVGDRVASTFKNMNRKLTGPLVGGAAASMTLLAAMSDRGYHPEPLAAPGEAPIRRVDNSVNSISGAGFSDPDPNLSPDDFRRREDRYAMMDRPVNMGSTYMTSPSSYRVGIETRSPFEAFNVSGYLGSQPGFANRTSVRINDTRHPITRNYMDRISGEY